MNKKVISSCIALGLTLAMTTTTFASPSDDLKSKQSELKSKQSVLDNTKKNIQDLESKIQKFDAKIEAAMREGDKTKAKIDSTKKDIEKIKKDIEKAEKDIKRQKETYKKRLKTMYINGNEGYVNVIFESKGFSDFFSKLENISRIQEFDKKTLTQFNEKKQYLDDKNKGLFSEKNKLEDLQKGQNETIAKLQKDKEDQSKLIERQQAEQVQQESQVAASQQQIDSIKNKIESQIQQQQVQVQAQQQQQPNSAENKPIVPTNKNGQVSHNPTPAPSRGNFKGSGSAIVSYAYQFMGTPYVWGGTSPSGFDCSGFMQYVYGHFGVSLGRTTYAQVLQGRAVSRGELQPGDLVFFGSEPHHVGMYVGNGCYIHAPHTGDVVKISSLGSFSSARRVL